MLSHLALWNILEISSQKELEQNPLDGIDYFYYQPNGDNLSTFRDEIYPLVKDNKGEFDKVIKIARYLQNRYSKSKGLHILKWDSPRKMLEQIDKGLDANCFHRAILFSTYLSSIGIKSRLWALENERFDGTSHTISEFYATDLNKWVFIDTAMDFYVTENERPLSFLEFRKKILTDDRKDLRIHGFDGSVIRSEIPCPFRRLVILAFLRNRSDFVDIYDSNRIYGRLSVFKKYLDKLPDSIRIAISYLFGKKMVFIHYVDDYSPPLKPLIFIAKTLFYFFIASLVVVCVFFILFLKKPIFPINFSKNDTFQR